MVFSREEAREEIAVALDLPRDWREEERVACAVDALVDASFVESSGCPASLEWLPALLPDMDPMQEAWSEAVVSSGVLEAMSAVGW